LISGKSLKLLPPQILRLKCTKIDWCWPLGLSPRPRGSLQRSSRPYSWNKGNLLLREGEGCREGKGKRGRERDEKGREERESEGDPNVCL